MLYLTYCIPTITCSCLSHSGNEVELLNIQLKRPGVGTRRFYITWEDAERVRQLREDPLRLDELKHPPPEKRGSDLDA